MLHLAAQNEDFQPSEFLTLGVEVEVQLLDLNTLDLAPVSPRLLGGLGTLLSIPYWFAPALVHWGGQGVGQSLFSSTLALWRNKGAFTTFMATWVAVVAVTSVLVGRDQGQVPLDALQKHIEKLPGASPSVPTSYRVVSWHWTR